MRIGNECEVSSLQYSKLVEFLKSKLESSTVSATISVDSSSESVSRKVEKVSQNVDMDTMPVCFGDFKKCTVNFNFK